MVVCGDRVMCMGAIYVCMHVRMGGMWMAYKYKHNVYFYEMLTYRYSFA